MMNKRFFYKQELSKTSDHAPSRTFYLFTMNTYQVVRKLLDYTYQVQFYFFVFVVIICS